MNIKGLTHITTTDFKTIEKSDRSVKSDITHDRDANGQQTFGDGSQKQQQKMNEEQAEKALEHLMKLPAFKEHKWTAELETSESGFSVVIKDNLGNIIRKIPESELWSLPDLAETKGQLLKKTA